ncbi:MAG: hypothetical protein ABID83_02690 [Candidatus Omnitrophota bacterium]
MKLKTIYDLAVKKALREDQRSRRTIEEALRNVRKDYRKTRGADRDAFDRESLKHPYDDSRILNGSGTEEVKNVMEG